MELCKIPTCEEIWNWLERKHKFTHMPEGLTYFQKLAVIKKYYEEYNRDILYYFSRSKWSHFFPYPFEWEKIFTPIEEDAWMVIRCIGIPLYPQYPVGKYFIDFANPGLKIGIELDGKEWHTPERDIPRDLELYEDGWSIFRIPGKEMLRNDFINEYWEKNISEREFYEDGLFNDWIMNTGHGVLTALKRIYFNGNSRKGDEFSMMIRDTYYRSLHKHSYYHQEFPL